jgi:adenosylcobinamide kinase/adenosylcobinamide-phosphate guanylyltransferase
MPHNKGNIVFILGGARSGKSRVALQRASEFSGKKAYIATAQALDDEMKERIDKHKKERSGDWTTFEEPINISGLIKDIHKKYDVIIVDCLTLWLSNLMHTDSNIQRESELFISLLTDVHCSLLIVSNEVGLGIVPDNAMARKFRDLSGYVNQRVAETADEVYLVTAGIPVKIK